jgi:hypothetical protein
MVPAGKRLLVDSFIGSSINESTADARTVLRLSTPNFYGHDFISQSVLLPLAAAGFVNEFGSFNLSVPMSFTEGQVIGIIFETTKSASITGCWFGWIEDV